MVFVRKCVKKTKNKVLRYKKVIFRIEQKFSSMEEKGKIPPAKIKAQSKFVTADLLTFLYLMSRGRSSPGVYGFRGGGASGVKLQLLLSLCLWKLGVIWYFGTTTKICSIYYRSLNKIIFRKKTDSLHSWHNILKG